MPFVLDASVAACWAFPDEAHATAELALNRLQTDEASTPALWWFEVRNVLVVNERRKRLKEAETAHFLRFVRHLPVVIDTNPDEANVLRLARKHRLSVYDAAYLEVAVREGVALATLDKELAKAARAEGLPPLQAA